MAAEPVSAFRYRDGHDFALWSFVGDALVFDHGRPFLYSGFGPLFDVPVPDGALVVRDGNRFEVVDDAE